MLAGVLVGYLVLALGIAFRARGKIHNAEDFIVAGRRLSFPLSTATLVATWIGASRRESISPPPCPLGTLW